MGNAAEQGGTVAATLAVVAMDQSVITTGTPWTATLSWGALGTVGNGKVLDVRFDIGSGTVEVRDNQRSDGSGGGWQAAPGTVGVLVLADAGFAVTVADIEAAINASSALCDVTTADPSPTKEIDIGIMETANVAGTFTGGL